MKFDSQKIEFHILQSFPVSCLNRDDVGSPKSCMIGGVTRARVSSQCWKRAVRLALHDLGIKTGIRTKRVANLLENACLSLSATKEQAENFAKVYSWALTDDTLIFLSEQEIEKIAYFAKEQDFKADLGVFELPAGKQKTERAKLAKEIAGVVSKSAINENLDALDIALFGRMVANATEMNIEAASSFSHAISTHKVTSDFDFFTAVDDCKGKDEQNSAHLGTSEFNAATYYRYVCLDLGQLSTTLGNGDGTVEPELMKKAVDAFIKALFLAVPSARQHVEAAYRPWDYARVYLRKGQPLQASFETPIKADNGGGYLGPSKKALKSCLDNTEQSFGSLFRKQACFEFDPESNCNYSIDSLISDVRSKIE